MTSFLRSDRSRAVAIWLYLVAGLVLAMVVVGGATRLTGSGLSITEWKPVTGAIPPLSPRDWQVAFEKYRQTSQYHLLNAGMSLARFQSIYWWEWAHRFLGRLVGVVFFVPFVWFALRREVPSRLLLRLGAIFILGALQAVIGWWMVKSGLDHRVSVAPERLTVHLGLAFALLGALVWTALDAWAGWARQTLPSPWGRAALWMVALIYLQILLGALVAGNDAGLVYNDFPLMDGRLVPVDYYNGGFWATVAHGQAAVQFHHRLMACLVFAVALAMALTAWRSSYLARQSKALAMAVASAVTVQAALGIATLTAGVPFGLAIAHQLMAALTLWLAVTWAWRVRRI